MMTDASTLEADDSHDNSLIGNTPMHNTRKRLRSTNAKNRSTRNYSKRNNGNKTDSASQASFEDSNAENDPSDTLNTGSPSPKKTKRKVTRSRPVRKTRSSAIAAAAVLKDASNSVLGDINERSDETGNDSPMPKTSRKRQLYNVVKDAETEVFTPTKEADEALKKTTPKTIVKRQLRSRSKRH